MTRKGQKHNICGAILPNGIDICKAAPGAGTDHLGFGQCKHHGGATPNGYKTAAVREARSRGKQFGLNLQPVDPHDAMRQELARTHDILNWARDMCQAIIDEAEENARKPEHERDPKVERPIDVISDNRFVSYKLVLDDERDRLVRIARASMDSSLAHRKQALAEALAAVVIECFHSMTRAIPDLTPQQLNTAQDTLKAELQVATERLLLTAGDTG